MQTLDEATAIIDAALAEGINLIDTADRDSAGESEEMVGKAIADRRRLVHGRVARWRADNRVRY